MTRWIVGVLLAAIASPGCGDPRLDVDIDAPDDIDAASIRLRVLVPPIAELFDCDDVAFRAIDDAAVDLSVVLDRTFRPGSSGADLSGIPRLGTKLFLAEGLDEGGALLFAGCQSVGDVTDDVSIVIATDLATDVTVDPGPIDAPIEAIDGEIAGPGGEPLDGVPVRWTLVGAGDNRNTGEIASAGGGRFAIEPGALPLPGPQLLEVSPRWVRGAPVVVNGFDMPEFWVADAVIPTSTGFDQQTGVTLDERAAIQIGRVGPSGELGFAAASPIDPGLRQNRITIVFYDSAAEPPFTQVSSGDVAEVHALGIVPDAGGGRDRVVAKRGPDWIELRVNDAGNAVEALPIVTTALPGSAVRIVPIGPCDGSRSIVLAELASGTLAAFDADAGFDLVAASVFTATPELGQVIESGCVADASGNDVYRTVAFAPARPSECGEPGGTIDPDMCNLPPVVIVIDGPGEPHVPLFSAPDSIAFAAAIGDSRELLLAQHLSLDGQAVGKYQLVADGSAMTLDLIDTESTVFPPASPQAGDFDRDGQLDIAAMAVVASDATVRLVQALAVDYRGHALIGLAPENRRLQRFLRAADFDGDGYDDLLTANGFRYSIAPFGPEGP